MACYAYHKVQGQVGDCFSFVEKADTWFDNVNRTNSLDTWLSWCFVGLITSHCFMVVLSTGLIHQDSHTRGYWGEPTVSRGSCEVDYGLTQWVGELHNSYSNLMFLFVGLISFDQYRRHRLPRRMAIIAVFLLLMGLSGIALHITLQYQLELFNDISQAGLMVALYHCRGPAQYAAGYRPMALISAAHFLAAAGCLLMNIEWFRELHMLVMLCLILHQNYHGTKEHPRLFQRVMRAFFLILGCGLCYLLDGPSCWLMLAAPVNPQLLALSNLLAAISIHEVAVVCAVLVAEDMGGEAELGVIGYGPGYQEASLVGWAGISYVDDIEYGIKSVDFEKRH